MTTAPIRRRRRRYQSKGSFSIVKFLAGFFTTAAYIVGSLFLLFLGPVGWIILAILFVGLGINTTIRNGSNY